MRYLYDFEPDADGMDAGGGGDEPAVDTPVVDDGVDTGGNSADATSSAPDYGAMWSDPGFQAGMAGFLQQIGGGQQDGYTDQQPPQPQFGELPEIDPYDPESLAAHLEARDARNNAMQAQAFANAIQQVWGPYQPLLERQAQEAWKQETDSYYGQIEKQYGSFDHELARSLAAGVDALGEVQYGQNAHDIAARKLSEYVKSQRAEAVEQYKQSLRGDDSTRFDPPVRGAGVDGESAPKDELDAARRWAGRNAAAAV